jgi:hypothetical protein
MAKSALMSCPACQKEIARTAKTCPNCGAARETLAPVFIVTIGLLLFFPALSIVADAGGLIPKPGDNRVSEATMRASCLASFKKDYPYASDDSRDKFCRCAEKEYVYLEHKSQDVRNDITRAMCSKYLPSTTY